MQERQRSCSVVWALISCRVQVSFYVLSIALGWAATASSAMAISTGCTRNAHALFVALEWAATASSAMAVSIRCTRNEVGSRT